MTIATKPTGKYYEDLNVGDEWTSAGRTMTETDIVIFAGFSGDYHPLHTNEEYAKTTQFGTRMVHGPAVFAIATGLEVSLGIKNGTAVAFLGMTWNNRLPVFPGDTIRVYETVASKRESKKPDRGLVVFDVRVLNQRDEVVQEGQWNLLMYRRPQ